MAVITKSASRSDATLIRAAKAGDWRALNSLVTRYEPRIFRFSYRLTGNADDAQDVAQDTLMAMARSLKTFRGEAALGTWLYSVARREALRKFRKRAQQQARERSLDEIETADDRRLASGAPTPEERAAANERDDAINAALQRLTPPHREVLLLRDVEGLTAPETAKTLGIGVRAVKSRLHRARVSLRSELGPIFTPEAVPTGKPGCRHVVEQFSKSLEGELGPSTCVELEKHLKGCRGCRAVCASLEQVLKVCRRPPSRDLSGALKRSLRQAVRQMAR